MADIIRLLSDRVANQIAAGEVILRPASVVKELLENAVDANAATIRVVIKEAGKSLIQVVDDGSGMSGSDARMCFERHATSKIRETEDLFAIRTMGFRGEALASIAAIAQVELKTKRKEDELGTSIVIEGAAVKSQEAVSCPAGSSFSVKNLFFNVPARRNFLKSDTIEFNHILEEFNRVALVNQDITFILFHNNREVLHVTPGNTKQRIVQLFGSHLSERLVPVDQESVVVSIRGWIGKPEHAKKTRGEQYFFVNGRFIRHPFFHHAVDTAYRQLIPEGHFPAYFIYFGVEPASLDVNIHPTKTEVKFLDDKVIYALLHSTVKQGLGRYSLTPAIDFDTEPSLDLGPRPAGQVIEPPRIRINPDYNPFHNRLPDPLALGRNRSNRENWEKLYESNLPGAAQQAVDLPGPEVGRETATDSQHPIQVKNRFILAAVRSGIMIIDQQRAHERILFERYLGHLEKQEVITQHTLFPLTVGFSPADAALLGEILEDIRLLGFDITSAMHSKEAFVISGKPGDIPDESIQPFLEEMLEHFKQFGTGLQWDKNTRLAASMAGSMCLKAGTPLQSEEMNNLLDELFSCKAPDITPDGKPVLRILSVDELETRLNKSNPSSSHS